MAKQRNEQVTNIDARKQLKRCQLCLLSHWLTVDARITELHPASSLPPLPFLSFFLPQHWSQPYTLYYIVTSDPKTRPTFLQQFSIIHLSENLAFSEPMLLSNNICKQRLDVYEAVEFKFIMKRCNLYSVQNIAQE